MARIGIVAGAPFDFSAAPAAVQRSLARAAEDGPRHLTSSVPNLGATRNTWLYLANGMGVYGTDYLRRAVIAMVGLGANLPEDAIYPLTHVSADGRPLDGRNRYVLRFPAGQEPPVGGFWSVTLYDEQGFQVPNALNRFAIGDRDRMTRSSDGSLEIIVQHEDPGQERRSNWLPAPNGRFNLTMRLYAPLSNAIDGRWSPPAVQMVSPASPLLRVN